MSILYIYADNLRSYSLMGSGQFDKAGILAADFSGVEAASPGFAVSSPDVFPRAGWGHRRGHCR